MTKILLVMMCAVFGMNLSSSARPYFDKSKDLLVAQFDSKPDTDDIHTQAALGCMLAHDEFNDVDYIAVAGAYGDQDKKWVYIDSTTLFNMAFGTKNVDWTDAHNDSAGSCDRVRNRAKAVLDAGGTVWVQEAGQSNFTADWVAALIRADVPESVIKAKVIVVQHSKWNEQQTNPDDLAYVKAKTDYVKIEDGNGKNATPGFNTFTTTYLTEALASPNSLTRSLWAEADVLVKKAKENYVNPRIDAGGVDFSDTVEDWWIFNDSAVTDIDQFWKKYVVNPIKQREP